MIFTDLDGTLLDFESYEPGPAAAAVALCRQAGVPVIPATSKTAVEVIRLRESLDLESPFIVENGALLFLPDRHEFTDSMEALALAEGRTVTRENGFLKIIFGMERPILQERLAGIMSDLGVTVRPLSQMSEAEISAETGLPAASARAVNQREYSEPFLLGPEHGGLSTTDRYALLDRFRDEAIRSGLNCLLGGRFFHLLGDHSKGTTARFVINGFGQASGSEWTSMALGDAPNDFDLLREVDHPVLVKRPDGSHAQGLEIPRLTATDGIGPAGWHEAVTARLETITGGAD
ncbi:HAD-IIB family hydrolase [Gemmatimonadota bacterium]